METPYSLAAALIDIAVKSSTAFITFSIWRLVHIFLFTNSLFLEETTEETGVQCCDGLLPPGSYVSHYLQSILYYSGR